MLSASCFYNFSLCIYFLAVFYNVLGFYVCLFVLLSFLESVVIPESMGFIDFGEKINLFSL